MLTLTPNAVQAIRDLTASTPEPENTGVRIASQENGSGSLVLSLTTQPEPTDEVIEAQGARVYLDAAAAGALDDKALDAGTDDRGGVAFVVTEK
ncbi:Fe-S cluster assembly protein HesB [Nonomuraea sp. NPDC050556]|uniref:Fe-S cluster assembly protein HesB n=1 Tax=Nonomuraea sp. NPDC050556 TaxID=3364369 RepID=UPI0037B7A919